MAIACGLKKWQMTAHSDASGQPPDFSVGQGHGVSAGDVNEKLNP